MPDYLYLMTKEKFDNIINKQYEIAKPVAIYINELNREEVYSIVKQLNDLEEGRSMIIDDNSQTVNDNTSESVTINKNEYENLKTYEKELNDFEFYDFVLYLTRGSVVPQINPNYNKNRVNIKIFNQEKYSIYIDGREYNIKSIQLFNKIKKVVSDNLNILINWSIRQNKFNLDNNAYDGGTARSIKIKYGNLIINVNGQVHDIGNSCDEFIEEIKQLIITEGEKIQDDYAMEAIEKIEPQTPTPLDEEFDRYCELYEEKFDKKAYIPEPSGTKEFAIECIKKCLDENKDILDDLFYPNFKKDMENGVLYEETKQGLNNDKFAWKEGEIKIAKTQCEFCKYNDKEHPNACSQYSSGKPNEVISNYIKCSKFTNKVTTDLDL